MNHYYKNSQAYKYNFLPLTMIGIAFLMCLQTAWAEPLTGTKKVVALRVYFQDYAETSRYSKAEMITFYGNLDQLWQDTSYGNIDITAEVTGLFQLPDNRNLYIDDFPTGDLSNGGKFSKVLQDAINNSPVTVDWNNVDAVNVIMSETDAAQFHRGQATTCTLPMGPGGSLKQVGCAIFSENPASNDLQVWGRFAHEMGHSFQQGGPAHPSNYQSEFELMDANYPGQTGVFEKQDHIAFPGWLPGFKYQEFTPLSGGGVAALWAMEYDPTGQPNVQAVKVKVTDSLYYLVSVRRRVLGDDTNGDFSPPGIPDEGVLIERVSEGSEPWVVVIGKGGVNGVCGAGCDRNDLWDVGDIYSGTTDGVFIEVQKKRDDDNYFIRVSYQDQAFMPDVMLNPWTSPPGNTWETTDIWIDSPINGYDTFRYGKWDDGSGNLVPRGNGDDPAIGQVNRLYARVRNVGSSPATDVEVEWELTDPPGLGIAGANGWASLGSVDKNDFPDLANIPAGEFVDVYIDWTPNFPISAEDMAAGRFAFHSCLRVKLAPVFGETVLGNQDGDREQENIAYFQAPSAGEGGEKFVNSIRLHNDDAKNKKQFLLSYSPDVPKGWKVDVNHGKLDLLLGPDEARDIPITIIPDETTKVGDIHSVEVFASSLRMLVNDLNPKDQHPEYKKLGGVRVEARTMKRVRLNCQASSDDKGFYVKGDFLNTPDFESVLKQYFDSKQPWKVLLQGVIGNKFVAETAQVVITSRDGHFEGFIPFREQKYDRAVCLFAGTEMLMSASSGFLLPDDKDSDNDSIVDSVDNCIKVKNPDQRDTNNDGFGNMCDGDLDNNGVVSTPDLSMFKKVLFTKESSDADFDGDGSVSTSDLTLFKKMLFGKPGPSGLVK